MAIEIPSVSGSGGNTLGARGIEINPIGASQLHAFDPRGPGFSVDARAVAYGCDHDPERSFPTESDTRDLNLFVGPGLEPELLDLLHGLVKFDHDLLKDRSHRWSTGSSLRARSVDTLTATSRTAWFWIL